MTNKQIKNYQNLDWFKISDAFQSRLATRGSTSTKVLCNVVFIP